MTAPTFMAVHSIEEFLRIDRAEGKQIVCYGPISTAALSAKALPQSKMGKEYRGGLRCSPLRTRAINAFRFAQVSSRMAVKTSALCSAGRTFSKTLTICP